nr:unnamed protein product [Callosobruchus chinensis]
MLGYALYPKPRTIIVRSSVCSKRKIFLTIHFPCPLRETSTLLSEGSQYQLPSKKSKRSSNRRVILPKTEKSQQVFNEHELLGLSIRVEVQKNSRLIGQCHRCQKYGHAQSYCTASPKCLKDHPANSPTCRFTPRRNLQVIAQRQTISYADAAKDASLTAPAALSSPSTAQSVDLATALKSLQQIISPLISATQALQAIFPVNV